MQIKCKKVITGKLKGKDYDFQNKFFNEIPCKWNLVGMEMNEKWKNLHGISPAKNAGENFNIAFFSKSYIPKTLVIKIKCPSLFYLFI